MDKKRVWCYIRVSTLEQAENWFWKDTQLKKIKTIIDYEEDNWFEFNEDLVYSDLWISWSKDENERPSLKRLKKDIEDWKIDIVIVWRLDRLARSTIILLDLIDFFKQHNVKFVSTEEKVDTTSPTWEFFITVLWAIAQMERKLIAEKTTMWKLEWLKKWFFTNWGRPKFWFKKNIETRKVEIEEKEAEIVKKIFDYYVNEDQSLSQIANLLTSQKIPTSFDWKSNKKRKNEKNKWIWLPTFISRMLSDTSYIWNYVLSKTKLEDYFENDVVTWKKIKKVKRVKKDIKDWVILEVENIIEPEIFDKVQEKLAKNKHLFNNNNKPIINHLFAWLIKC